MIYVIWALVSVSLTLLVWLLDRVLEAAALRRRNTSRVRDAIALTNHYALVHRINERQARRQGTAS
jgi:hypothetical protein